MDSSKIVYQMWKFVLLFGMLEEAKSCAQWKIDTRRRTKPGIYRLIERWWRRRQRRRISADRHDAQIRFIESKSSENSYGSNWVPLLSDGSDTKIICPGHSMFSVVKITRIEFCVREVRNLMLARENTQLQFVNVLKLSIVFLPIISSKGKWT